MDVLIRPKCAFVTIESEVAYNYLADVETEDEHGQLQSGRITLAGHRSKVAEAPEPTNVIWENRDFDKAIRWRRLIYIIIAVILVLFITFMATVKAKSMTNEIIGKYDESINCDELARMYDGKTLSRLAANEWMAYYRNGGEINGRQINPTLSCFCT